MPKGRPTQGKWVTHKIPILGRRNCYIYKRPNSEVWQYYLQMDGEGQLRASTRIEGSKDDINVGQEEAIEFATNKYLDARGRSQTGMKAIVKKKLFDLMDDFLKEEKKRIRPYNVDGYITERTFYAKNHHLNLLKKFYSGKNIAIEKIDWEKLYDYPLWRAKEKCNKQNPIAITPPKTQQTISAELTTIRGYFAFLLKRGYILKVPEFKRVVREKREEISRDYLNYKQYKQTNNTLTAWAKSKTATPSQTYNRHVLRNAIFIMTNSLLRVGTLRNLEWRDLDVAENLDEEQQKIGHLIRVRKEACKVGVSRKVISPTVEYFNRIRELAGIPKAPRSQFPHVPPEYMNFPILSKWKKVDERMGNGTFYREWCKIKELCQARYWGSKNITWYSFRHTGITFNIERKVPLLQLAKIAGTSLKEIEHTYYHHEQESKETWNMFTQNRIFWNKIKADKNDLVAIDKLLEAVEV